MPGDWRGGYTQLRVCTVLAELWNLVSNLKSVSQQSITLVPGTPLTSTSLNDSLCSQVHTHKITKFYKEKDTLLITFQPSSQTLAKTIRKEIEIKGITGSYLSISLTNVWYTSTYRRKITLTYSSGCIPQWSLDSIILSLWKASTFWCRTHDGAVGQLTSWWTSGEKEKRKHKF